MTEKHHFMKNKNIFIMSMMQFHLRLETNIIKRKIMMR